jgi:hypothetical protein
VLQMSVTYTPYEDLIESIHEQELAEPRPNAADRGLDEAEIATAREIDRAEGPVQGAKARKAFKDAKKAISEEPAVISFAIHGTMQELVTGLMALDEDQYHGGPVVISSWAAQRVRENPGLRGLFEIQALGDDMEKAEFARLVLKAARDFKYRRD